MSGPQSILIIGGSRGIGLGLAKQAVSKYVHMRVEEESNAIYSYLLTPRQLYLPLQGTQIMQLIFKSLSAQTKAGSML
jgi:NAD(P)-dependent dehydrogenase (short-subunit alcohol dehydrogenase family)